VWYVQAGKHGLLPINSRATGQFFDRARSVPSPSQNPVGGTDTSTETAAGVTNWIGRMTANFFGYETATGIGQARRSTELILA
jgi:hypothetical protein